MAVNSNWLDSVCIVQDFHTCLEARVEFAYVHQLIFILVLKKDITMNLGHKYADRIFGWQHLQYLHSRHKASSDGTIGQIITPSF